MGEDDRWMQKNFPFAGDSVLRSASICCAHDVDFLIFQVDVDLYCASRDFPERLSSLAL